MQREYSVWFTNINGCAIGINNISLIVNVTAASDEQALELALDIARQRNDTTGMPPHGLRVTEKELRRLACVSSDKRDASE